MTKYTVLVYWPDGVDTCRNCEMGRSSSDFEYKIFELLDDAVKFWAAKIYDSQVSDREYCSWELTLLIDGVDDSEDWPAMDVLAVPYINALAEAERVKQETIANRKAMALALQAKVDNDAREAAEMSIYLKVQERLKAGKL